MELADKAAESVLPPDAFWGGNMLGLEVSYKRVNCAAEQSRLLPAGWPATSCAITASPSRFPLGYVLPYTVMTASVRNYRFIYPEPGHRIQSHTQRERERKKITWHLSTTLQWIHVNSILPSEPAPSNKGFTITLISRYNVLGPSWSSWNSM